jgi:outer membrane lipoprotein-sorting protein
MIALSIAVILAGLQEAPDPAAEAALRRLSDRFRDARTLSARVVQTRKTALLDRPLSSSGTLFYRRDPARLVFRMTEPRATEIHLDRASYQVYRPDEKRLERTDFADDETAPRLFMAFQPRSEEIGKAFSVRRGEGARGEIEVLLEPSDPKVKRHLSKLVLAMAEEDATLKRIATTDAEGDEVRIELSEVRVNPELPADTFDLSVPEGTRVFRHALKPGK